MAELRLEQVSKRYGAVEAVREVSLEVPDGELVTLVGPSGCGKSTLLSIIAGLEAPSGGRVWIGGQDVTALDPGARDVAMVFQSYALYPHLDVRRNLGFPLRMAGVSRAELDRRVLEVAERLGLGELLSRKPRELSGGQRQRVALGRALVRRPRLFLFDEPLSNLDPALRGQMRAEIKRLHEELRATFVYVTHDQLEAMTLSDRVVVLDRGVVQQVAPPQALYEQPANLFVAQFVGEPRINLVPLALLGLDGEGVAGIRPEHLELGLGAPADGAIAGRIELVEPLGRESWITLVSDSTRLVARTEADFRGRPGDAAWWRPRPENILRFDARGSRINPG